MADRGQVEYMEDVDGTWMRATVLVTGMGSPFYMVQGWEKVPEWESEARSRKKGLIDELLENLEIMGIPYTGHPFPSIALPPDR